MLEQHDHHPTVPLVLLPLNVISLLTPFLLFPGSRKVCGYFGNLVENIFAHVSKQQIPCNLCINNFMYFVFPKGTKAWPEREWLEKSLAFLNYSIVRESLWGSFEGVPFKIKLNVGFCSNQDSRSSGLNRYTLL